METGALLALLASHGFLYLLIYTAFIRKGLIWLLVATIAEVLPAVGGYFNMTVPPPIIMSQVFICLNLNGKFTLFISSMKNADD